VVLASVPHTFTAGETLTAANLNSNFAAVDQRLAALEAAFPSGSIVAYGGPSGATGADGGAPVIPTGWLLCDGSAVSRTTYAPLFAAIGINFGGGDGIGTFNLPDLRGRTVIGAGHGTGLTARALAQTVGEETHTLTTGEVPAHTHALTDPGHSHTITPQAGGGAASVGTAGSSSCGVYCGTQQQSMVFTNTVAATTTTNITMASAGGGAAHNTMPPSMVLNYLIKL
jgi:microcystin-dependent protein